AQPPRAGAAVPAARPEARQPPARRPEPDRPFEELLPAEGYGVYVEVRRLGSLFELGELKTALAVMRLVGDADAAALVDTADFVNRHAELLADSRLVVAALRTQPGIPQGLVALQLPTPEKAAGFEQEFRAFLNGTAKALGLAQPPPPRPARGRAAGRQQSAKTKPAPPGLTLKRAGSWLIAADQEFKPGRLRPEGAASLAESARFQSLRNRFSTEQLFVYFDTGRVQQGWMLATIQEEEERQRAQAAADTATLVTAETAAHAPAARGGEAPATTGVTSVETTVVTEVAIPAPSADGPPAEGQAGARGAGGLPPSETVIVGTRAAGETEEVSVTAPVTPPPPTPEQLASRRMDRLMRGLWGGVPRLPGTVAAAVGLEGGAVALRVAVEHAPDGPVNLIPFLPNVVSGTPVTTDAAQVAPADGDIFFSASLDWARIFDALMGTAREEVRRAGPEPVPDPGVLAEEAGLGLGEDGKPLTAEAALAEVEKFFGFKIKEDFLPALGGEVAVSLPFEGFSRNFRLNRKEGEEERDAEPGFLILVSLNDPDKARRLLPRALALLGVVPLGSQPAVTETREGVEISVASGFSYAFVGDFLVAGDLKNVRHAADSWAARRTLASTNGYRDATAWQARQKLVQGFVSEELMRHTIEESKKQAAGSTDPVVHALVSQLEVQPEAASLATTNEGDVLLHELRVPLNLIKVFAAGMMIGVKEAPVIGNEMAAAIALGNIRTAEEVFRGKEGRERFGTLEELVAEDLFEKNYVERLEYRFELHALGDKFEATATPKNYGKTGRRSFFLDETGVIRAADHKGKPASAQDPPID
ncbi:MAG TPA: hypothetical protein VG148_15455, partial [Pyrinomonadaceae bacterium]|nr:hypothetical protein [Pyrinomonadaceae bacterium]